MQSHKENCRFYVLTELRRGGTAKATYEKLRGVWGDMAPGFSTVKRWWKEYASGARQSLSDSARCGRPVTSRLDATIAMVRDFVESDPRLSVRDLSELTGIPSTSVYRILTESLDLHSVCSVWVPHTLSAANLEQRVNSAQHIRHSLLSLGDAVYSRYVVEDETWIDFCGHRTKSENRVWIPKSAPRPQVPRPALTSKKTLTLLAFSSNKRFSVRALSYGTSIDSAEYVAFVRNTGNRWRSLRANPIHLRDVLWQHDNARPHTSAATKEFFQQRQVKTIWQAPYSPDLNLCDRWLFNLLKTELRKEEYKSEKEVENAALRVLRRVDEAYFQHELAKLLQHCEAVISCGGHYVTK